MEIVTGSNQDPPQINLLTKTTCSECKNESNICSSEQVISKIYNEITGKPPPEKHKALDELKEITKCTSESCVLTKTKDDISDETLEIVEKELSNKFKPRGPRNTKQLLSNIDIDYILQSWAGVYEKFYPCPFAMIDFPYYQCDLRAIDLRRLTTPGTKYFNKALNKNIHSPFNTFGCVLNTDYHNGRGIHWICIFADMRNPKKWSIEFFNSSGNSPHKNITNWIFRQIHELSEFYKKLNINLEVYHPNPTTLTHQTDNHSCGPYCLYYIRSRLDGVPYTYFTKNKVNDKYAVEFRKHLFREY